MSEEKTVVNTYGMGIFGALGILFVALKLLNYIDWSWWWVLLPFYGGLVLYFTILIIGAVVLIIAHIMEKK